MIIISFSEGKPLHKNCTIPRPPPPPRTADERFSCKSNLSTWEKQNRGGRWNGSNQSLMLWEWERVPHRKMTMIVKPAKSERNWQECEMICAPRRSCEFELVQSLVCSFFCLHLCHLLLISCVLQSEYYFLCVQSIGLVLSCVQGGRMNGYIDAMTWFLYFYRWVTLLWYSQTSPVTIPYNIYIGEWSLLWYSRTSL